MTISSHHSLRVQDVQQQSRKTPCFSLKSAVRLLVALWGVQSVSANSNSSMPSVVIQANTAGMTRLGLPLFSDSTCRHIPYPLRYKQDFKQAPETSSVVHHLASNRLVFSNQTQVDLPDQASVYVEPQSSQVYVGFNNGSRFEIKSYAANGHVNGEFFLEILSPNNKITTNDKINAMVGGVLPNSLIVLTNLKGIHQLNFTTGTTQFISKFLATHASGKDGQLNVWSSLRYAQFNLINGTLQLRAQGSADKIQYIESESNSTDVLISKGELGLFKGPINGTLNEVSIYGYFNEASVRQTQTLPNGIRFMSVEQGGQSYLIATNRSGVVIANKMMTGSIQSFSYRDTDGVLAVETSRGTRLFNLDTVLDGEIITAGFNQTIQCDTTLVTGEFRTLDVPLIINGQPILGGQQQDTIELQAGEYYDFPLVTVLNKHDFTTDVSGKSLNGFSVHRSNDKVVLRGGTNQSTVFYLSVIVRDRLGGQTSFSVPISVVQPASVIDKQTFNLKVKPGSSDTITLQLPSWTSFDKYRANSTLQLVSSNDKDTVVFNNGESMVTNKDVQTMINSNGGVDVKFKIDSLTTEDLNFSLQMLLSNGTMDKQVSVTVTVDKSLSWDTGILGELSYWGGNWSFVHNSWAFILMGIAIAVKVKDNSIKLKDGRNVLVKKVFGCKRCKNIKNRLIDWDTQKDRTLRKLPDLIARAKKVGLDSLAQEMEKLNPHICTPQELQKKVKDFRREIEAAEQQNQVQMAVVVCE